MSRADWANKKLRDAAEEMRAAPGGDRNNTLFRLVAAMSSYVADGSLSGAEVRRSLREAAMAAGLAAGEADQAINSGIDRDSAEKAWYPTGGSSASMPRRVRWRGNVYQLEHGRGALSALPPEAVGAPVTACQPSIRVTLYPSVRTTAGIGEVWTWQHLAEMVAEPEDWPEGGKMALPMWCAVELEGDDRARRPDGLDGDGRERMREPAVVSVNALVLDYDDDASWSIEQVRRWWGDVCYVAHTSASHAVPKDKSPAIPRGRVVVALSRGVGEAEYRVIADWCLASHRGSPGRKELANPRRAYFAPARAPGGYEYDAHLVDAALDVDEILRRVSDIEESATADDVTPDPQVWAGLDMRNDAPRDHLLNLTRILDGDPRWSGRVAWDEFVGGATIDGQQLTDRDEMRAAVWLGEVYAVHPPTGRVHEAIQVVAGRHSRHPVREYLRGLRWDGVERIGSWLIDYLGCHDDVLSKAYGRAWLVAGVARIMAPGAKVDEALILKGPQGAGKSRAIRALSPDPGWFSDSSLPIGEKDAYQQLRGVWIYELAELDSVRRSDWGSVKAFLSAQSDSYRASYARNQSTVPRQVLFAGTTNEATFLGDATGARRMWIREVGVDGSCRPELVARHRDQLWAEAVTRYDNGEVWRLDADEADLQREDAERYRQADPWEERIAHWSEGRTSITVVEILTECLGKRGEDLTRGDEMRVGGILASMGRVRKRVGPEKARRWAWVYNS